MLKYSNVILVLVELLFLHWQPLSTQGLQLNDLACPPKITKNALNALMS